MSTFEGLIDFIKQFLNQAASHPTEIKWKVFNGGVGGVGGKKLLEKERKGLFEARSHSLLRGEQGSHHADGLL